MKLSYKKATIDNLEILTETRIIVLRAGGVSYFQVMPTYHNPTGRKAYIINMYTKPEYRRKGIAFKTLDLLVADAKEKGISAISLEATNMGRPLYDKDGFVKMNEEMELLKKQI